MLNAKDFERVQHLLPDSVKDLAQIIGFEKTYLLIKHLGGTTFPVSKNMHKNGVIRYEMIAEIIGVTAADILTNHYGGDTVYIPRCFEALTEVCHRVIRARFDRETKDVPAIYVVADLAREYEVSDRHVWRILKEGDREDNSVIQDSLF
ncbi:Mor transcription activator family protein [Neisseria sp. Ec49-e6-T10]|uniref:Mor transcription activator family protein n=1 Tax=Neisseria sp. Ec49-e6-T10 TaxID=3140744 RepID=UPI003EBB91E2